MSDVPGLQLDSRPLPQKPEVRSGMDPRSPEAPLAVSDVDIVPERIQDLITCVNSAPKVFTFDDMSKFGPF